MPGEVRDHNGVRSRYGVSRFGPGRHVHRRYPGLGIVIDGLALKVGSGRTPIAPPLNPRQRRRERSVNDKLEVHPYVLQTTGDVNERASLAVVGGVVLYE